MAEVQTPGSPTPQAAPAAAPEAPAAPTGLEKVYSDFKIEDTAAEFQPQSPQPAQQQPQPQATPQKFDPFDPNFPAHMSAVQRAAVDAHSALQTTQAELSRMQREMHTQKVEADIKQAVGTLTEGTGINAKIAEVAMEAKAREDARFRSIWQNRGKNQAAYQAALKAFKQELQDTYTVRQDPQLAENQRAIKASQQQMATTTRVTENDRWASMTYQERQAEMNRIQRSG